jgi:hypothetical protein
MARHNVSSSFPKSPGTGFEREIFADAQCFSTGSGRRARCCVIRRARRWRLREIKAVIRDDGEVEMYLIISLVVIT